MDWRSRKYLLVDLNWITHNETLHELKLVIPGLKIHSAYNHIKARIREKDHIEGRLVPDKFPEQGDTPWLWWTEMVSFPEKYKDDVEYRIAKCTRNHFTIKELTKEICEQ